MNRLWTCRWGWLGAVILAILAFHGLQIAVGDPPDGGGDPVNEYQLKDVRSGSVHYGDGHVDESGEKTAADRISFGQNNEVTIVSRWFNAPSGWSFKAFPVPFDDHYADVMAGGGANFTGDEFDGGRVYVWGQYDSQTAEVFPLYAEGNLSRHGGGGGGGGGGSVGTGQSGGETRHWAAKVADVEVSIVASNEYLVPGSMLNAVRYKFGADAPDSARFEVYDKNSVLVRTIMGIPTTNAQGKDYVELKWNAHKNQEGTSPLLEAEAPYRLRVVGVWESVEDYAEIDNRLVEEWLMAIGIDDGPLQEENVVTGTDAATITPDTLEVRVGGDDQTPTLKSFDVEARTEALNGPSGNDWGAAVTPTFIFYTTPQTPYDIRYTVTIKQKTAIESVTGGGIDVVTIKDGVGNPWDMNPDQDGRQVDGTWTFGIDSNDGVATRRGLEELYE